MADTQLTCRTCGAQFIHAKVGRKPAFCGAGCKRVWENEYRRSRRKKPSAITPSMQKPCEGCRSIGGKTNRGLCRSCIAAQRRIVRAGLMRRHSNRNHMPPRLVDVRPPREVTCAECGCVHTYSPQFGEDTRRFCSRECQKVAADRVSTKARRAILRGCKVERVDPTKVLERDGWRCQRCGIKTPKGKRGTYESNAPELDHIMPLALGGEHSYRNTQCLCRSCNMKKSAKPFGQLSLL